MAPQAYCGTGMAACIVAPAQGRYAGRGMSCKPMAIAMSHARPR
jgi:hypothetical protein